MKSIVVAGWHSSTLSTIRVLVISVLLLQCSNSLAHFKLNLNIRVVHVEHTDVGLSVYMRLPMPYLVADRVGPRQSDGNRAPAPYTTNGMVDGELLHYVDYQALEDDPIGLGEFAAQGHTISRGDTTLLPTVEAVAVYTGISQPPFSTLGEAKLAFANNEMAPVFPAPFVGDAVVDVWLNYRGIAGGNEFRISSNLNPGLPGQEDTANLIVDYADPQPRIFRIKGLLEQPVAITRSTWAASKTFIVEGVRHILGGYDHVLFVVCLVLGTGTLPILLWRVTGFTVGHMFTLTLGFFGFVPRANWFVPLVELGIALSIIVAAVYALMQNRSSHKGVLMTVLIGMLHGLGFSFVLREILGVNSPNLWMSLLSFNIGVELGQVGIVLLVWSLLYLISRRFNHAEEFVRWIIALSCIGIAAYWTGQRGIELFNAFTAV